MHKIAIFVAPIAAAAVISGGGQPVAAAPLKAGTDSVSLNSPVTVTVDAAANRHPISPLIYGANFSGPEHAAMNSTINRIGGNNESRYNWKQNAKNVDQDWFFESVPTGDATPGKYVDDLIEGSKKIGALPMVTIPTIGWVAKLGPNREKLSSFSVAKYGPQKSTDTQWFPDGGNGIKPDGTKITGNDPNEANVPADSAFMQEWVRHLVSKWGTADKGGVRYYIMDNEPNLWQDTHRDVHPDGPTMEEVRDKIFDYAARVKAADPSALIVAPEAWDWNGSRWSGADIQHGSKTGDWDQAHMPDRTAHGGADFLPWMLDQFRDYEKKNGKRLVDVCSFHYYPQEGNDDDVSEKTMLMRNRSTRSLWDKNYKAESWVNDYIYILPHVKGWVHDHYPGLKIAFTEYNWGADNSISGATAQADVLGIIGREGGIDIATRFSAPKPGCPVFNAFRMYRNYDGKQSTFGDTSVQASVPQPDDLAAFAAVRTSDNKLTVIVVNKVLKGSTPINLKLDHAVTAGDAQVWQLTPANVIERRPDIHVSGGAVAAVVPAQSISLFVLPLKAQ